MNEDVTIELVCILRYCDVIILTAAARCCICICAQ